jgi:RNA polymerase sigma-70 factor (ECF subfamily)
VDIAPSKLTETKPLTTDAEHCTISASEEGAPKNEIGPVKVLLSELLARELWQRAGAELVELTESEFTEGLEVIGAKDNFGLDQGIQSTAKQREAFWRSLNLEELAVARGCALGREAAWQRFLTQYREPLTRIAVGMTGSTSQAEELTSALYSELFGLTEREGRRWSPLLGYSGRGSLMGWLRAILAQRRVNLYRKTSRVTALEGIEPEALMPESVDVEALEHLRPALEGAIATLSPEERFLLSAYYLDTHTLHELGGVLRVHEATVSRKLKRATAHVRKELLKALITRGLSRRAAEEMLGTDPRDVDVNLRNLLQNSTRRAISNKEGQR